MLMVGVVTVLNLALRGVVSPSNLLIIQLLPVVIAALFLGRAASVLAAAISILLFDLLFVPPYYTLAVSDWEYFISFVGYLVVALVISILAGRLRHLLPQVRESEATVEAVAGLSSDLEGAATTQEILERVADHLHRYTGGPAVVLVPEGGELVRAAGDASFPLDEKEVAIAAWVFENRAPAGRGLDTLPAGRGRYLPLVASGRALGVVGVIPGEEEGGRPETCSRGLPGSGRWSSTGSGRSPSNHVCHRSKRVYTVARPREKVRAFVRSFSSGCPLFFPASHPSPPLQVQIEPQRADPAPAPELSHDAAPSPGKGVPEETVKLVLRIPRGREEKDLSFLHGGYPLDEGDEVLVMPAPVDA